MVRFMERRTKIVCTLGPKTTSEEMIHTLYNSGMNVARLNFSHGTHASHKEVIDRIKCLREGYERPLGILLDTKGPEIRIGEIGDMQVGPGDIIRLVSRCPQALEIPVHPGFIVDDIEQGKEILFADGYVRGIVSKKGEGWADVTIQNTGVIERGKGINIPSQLFNLPEMTEQDKEDIAFGCREEVDFIAASFINTPQQLLAIREHMRQCGGEKIQLLAKIESQQGVKNFTDILQVADGIMIARGDLGVEIFVGEVPPLQKKMIRQCNLQAKPVIVATQMLESMIGNPMPTRAEASDVANAVYDGGSALMLSAETAVGRYPTEAVEMMNRIIVTAERDFNHRAHFKQIRSMEAHTIPSAIARSAVNTGFFTRSSAIIACSNSGNTVRHIARYHPDARIIAVTPSEKTYYQTSLLWGTEGYRETSRTMENGVQEITAYALKQKWVEYGDPVVITLGKPYGVSYTTNTIMVESVGGVLLRGEPMDEWDRGAVEGEITFALPKEPDFHGKIVVLCRFEESFEAALSTAVGVILQNHAYDVESERKLRNFSHQHALPFIYRADGACALLAEGQKVRLYPSLGLLFPSTSPTKEEML